METIFFAISVFLLSVFCSVQAAEVDLSEEQYTSDCRNVQDVDIDLEEEQYVSDFRSVQAVGFDREAEQLIFDCLHSTEFSHSIINYHFEGQNYPIVAIYNPQREPLWGCKAFSTPTFVSLIMTADLPFQLAHHLEGMFEELRGDKKDIYIDLRGFSSKLNFTSLQPVFIAESICDPYNDDMIEEAFHSSEFTNQVFYYYLNGEYYQVRILHNPKELVYTASRKFNLGGYASSTIALSWNDRYGIIVDQKAPQELIDHLSEWVPASWWDWYCSFKIHNGTRVLYEKYSYGYYEDTITTYTLDTWFDYTSDLSLKK